MQMILVADLTTSRQLTFIHAKLCLTLSADLRLTFLVRNLVFVCVDRMTSISATRGQAGHGRVVDGFYARTFSESMGRHAWNTAIPE